MDQDAATPLIPAPKILGLVRIAAAESGHLLGPWGPVDDNAGGPAAILRARCARPSCSFEVRTSAAARPSPGLRFAECPVTQTRRSCAP